MKNNTQSILAGKVEVIGPAHFVAAAAAKINREFPVAVKARGAKPKKVYRGKTTLLTTQGAFDRLMLLDREFVGTDNYMGLSYFWNYEFRHYLRDATQSQRCAVHDALRAEGLDLEAETPRHWEIVRKITRKN